MQRFYAWLERFSPLTRAIMAFVLGVVTVLLASATLHTPLMPGLLVVAGWSVMVYFGLKHGVEDRVTGRRVYPSGRSK